MPNAAAVPGLEETAPADGGPRAAGGHAACRSARQHSLSREKTGHGRTLTIREDITQDLGLMGFNITDVPHTPKQTYKKHVTLLK